MKLEPENVKVGDGLHRRWAMTKLLLKSGIVVTQDPKLGVLPTGDVLVEDGRIAAVAPRSRPTPRRSTAPATSCCRD